MANRNRLMEPETFAEVYSDLPDGAFFAMAEEHGLMPEDFICEESGLDFSEAIEEQQHEDNTYDF